MASDISDASMISSDDYEATAVSTGEIDESPGKSYWTLAASEMAPVFVSTSSSTSTIRRNPWAHGTNTDSSSSTASLAPISFIGGGQVPLLHLDVPVENPLSATQLLGWSLASISHLALTLGYARDENGKDTTDEQLLDQCEDAECENRDSQVRPGSKQPQRVVSRVVGVSTAILGFVGIALMLCLFNWTLVHCRKQQETIRALEDELQSCKDAVQTIQKCRFF